MVLSAMTAVRTLPITCRSVISSRRSVSNSSGGSASFLYLINSTRQVGFAMGRKYRVITVDTVPIFGAEAPGTAPVEVDVEAPNTATTALVVILIATDSGVSIFAS